MRFSPSMRHRFAEGPALAKPRKDLWRRPKFLAAVAGALVLINAEVFLPLLEEAIPITLEVAEQTLDIFFETFGLAPRTAQMVTAYIGLAALFAGGFWLARAAAGVIRRLGETALGLRDDIERRYAAGRLFWESLNAFGKALAVAGLIVIGIPVALLLSILLGSAVAVFL